MAASQEDTVSRQNLDGPSSGSTIVFKDVCVRLSKKDVLDKVYGFAKVGQMLAIMGPSGAGKSTLLNTLSGRIQPTSGSIMLNGQPVNRHIRRRISYVQQYDVFYPDLTLKETLTFTALLRLPESMPNHLKVKRVQEIVDLLELNRCFNTKIGGTFVTGLSGGEKKRASVACELLTNPKILLLDEPTSGLDSAIAFSIMSTLSEYCGHSHKTVLTTIHQPSSQIFHMFTNLLLITDGKVAYFGPGSKVLDHFSGIGLPCDPMFNPADFVLDKVKSEPEVVRTILDAAKVLRGDVIWPSEEHSNQPQKKYSTAAKITDKKFECKEEAELYSFKKLGKTQQNDHLVDEVDTEKYLKNDSKWQTGFLRQYSVLAKRTFLHSKSRYLSISVTIQVLCMAAFAGLEWFQIPRTEETARDRLGILFYTTVVMGFLPMSYSVFSLTDESGVFTRERSAGIYRLSAFYLARTTTEIPTLFVLTTVYTIIVYWMSGLMPAAENFFAHWIILILQVFTSQSIGMLIGIIVTDRSLTLIFLQSFLVGSLLAGGFYNTHAKWWFLWIKYLSYINYAFSAFSKVEFLYGAPLTCSPANSTMFHNPCATNGTKEFSGELYLESIALDASPIYCDILVLVCVCIATRIGGYFVLRYMRRPKV